MRSKATDDNIQLEPPRELTLEGALEYIEDDELIEVTPRSIRLRKRYPERERSQETVAGSQARTSVALTR